MLDILKRFREKMQNTTERDYDKEPIIIEDYNPLFAWLSFKYVVFPSLLVLFVVLFFYFPENIVEFSKLFIILPIASWPAYRQYKDTKGERKIVLSNHKIFYKHNDYVLTEIFLDNSSSFYLSFQNYYHKSQNRLKVWHLAIIFLMGVLITQSFWLNLFIFLFAYLYAFLALQMVKFILYGKRYRFYHALLVMREEDLVAIPFLKKSDDVEVHRYFAQKGIDIASLPKFYKFIYGYENIEIKEVR